MIIESHIYFELILTDPWFLVGLLIFSIKFHHWYDLVISTSFRCCKDCQLWAPGFHTFYFHFSYIAAYIYVVPVDCRSCEYYVFARWSWLKFACSFRRLYNISSTPVQLICMQHQYHHRLLNKLYLPYESFLEKMVPVEVFEK